MTFEEISAASPTLEFLVKLMRENRLERIKIGDLEIIHNPILEASLKATPVVEMTEEQKLAEEEKLLYMSSQ